MAQNNNKIIIAIGSLIAIVAAYFLIKKKAKSDASNEQEEAKKQATTDMLFSDTSDMVQTKITDDMTAEEKMIAAAKIEEEKELAAKMELLRQEYAILYGTKAPATATKIALENAIADRKEFNEMLKVYMATTGDSDTSDNNFNNIADIQLALKSFEVNEEEKRKKREKWEAGKAEADRHIETIKPLLNHWATKCGSNTVAKRSADEQIVFLRNFFETINGWSPGLRIYVAPHFAGMTTSNAVPFSIMGQGMPKEIGSAIWKMTANAPDGHGYAGWVKSRDIIERGYSMMDVNQYGEVDTSRKGWVD